MAEWRKSSKVVELGGPDRVAADWIARLDADDSAELRRQFQEWKDRSPYNREAAERLEHLWSELDGLSGFGAGAPPHAPQRRTRRRGSSPRRAAALGLSAAASIALVLGAAMAWSRYGPGAYQTYQTAVGKQQTVSLADGSTVQLNTNALLQVHFTRAARDLKLLRGEAFFEVAHDRNRPFTVSTPAGSVQAVGTAFSVRVDPGALHVTLVRGTIRGRRTGVGRAERPGGDSATVLTAQGGAHPDAIVTPQAIRRETMSSAAVARELSWRQGILVFDGDTLPAVIADMSRYTDVQVEIADPRLRDLKIAGYFDAGDLDAMLQVLQLSFGVHIERLDPKHVRLTTAQG